VICVEVAKGLAGAWFKENPVMAVESMGLTRMALSLAP
jgi:phage terminase large subunit-like protein